MEHASTVDIGERKRRSGGVNEDSIATAVLENHHRSTSRPVGIFVLGDGVGGEDSGDVASFLATTVVRKRLTEALLGAGTDVLDRFAVDAYDGPPPTADDPPESALSPRRIRSAIQDAVDAAHKRVQEYAKETDGRLATTLVVAVYVDGRLHYGWVGDSRAYLVNTRHGEIQQLTEDHAVTNDLLEQGEIDDEAYARVHDDATAITNAVGGSPYGKPTVDVEFGSTEVYREDVIVLTSDGLIDAYPNVAPLRKEYERADDTERAREEILEALVTDDEIRDIILDAADLKEGVEELVTFANDRGGKDNLSITLARDRTADPSPPSLPNRDAVAESDGLIDQETVIESPEAGSNADREPDADTGSSPSPGSTPTPGSGTDGSTEEDRSEVVSATDTGLTTAAITIAGTETIYEIVDGVTIGRDDDEADGNGPNIGLVVEDDSVECNHARIERDDDGDWWIRDTSTAGTFVEDDGEWLHLRSRETSGDGRQADGNPEADAPDDPHRPEGATCRLRDGTAFSLEDPRETDPVTFRFYTSVDRARNRRGETTDDGLLDRFRS